MTLTVRPLTTADWPIVEALFGGNGACGGCWCMSWRIEAGEKWDQIKGDLAKDRLRDLVTGGQAQAMLAFDGETPVGWCAFGPRPSFAKLHRAPSLACTDADDVWSVPCFFIAKGQRGKGVGTALLAGAVAEMGRRGVTVIEGYPVKPAKDGKAHPAAFAWTGTVPMFENQGFVLAGSPDAGKLRMRLSPS